MDGGKKLWTGSASPPNSVFAMASLSIGVAQRLAHADVVERLAPVC